MRRVAAANGMQLGADGAGVPHPAATSLSADDWWHPGAEEPLRPDLKRKRLQTTKLFLQLQVSAP